MQKYFLIFFLVCAVLAPGTVFSAEKVLIEVLSRNDCLHCDEEKAFFSDLSGKRNDFEVRFLDVADPKNKELLNRVAEAENLSRSTPITIVGTTILQGFDSVETTGARVESLIDRQKTGENYGFEKLLSAGGSKNIEKVADATCDDGSVCKTPEQEPFFVSMPVFGSINVMEYSLPALSSILGFIDGFNPCAMWVLVTFLLVLIQIGDRRKMWLVAGSFILAEAVMYYLILNVWFSTWDFIGLDRIVTPVVGVVAIGGGIFFLYEWLYGEGTCQVTDIEKRSKISRKIRDLVSKPFTWLTLVGIVVLALSVNVIEFACSIGIPQAFTKIVELNGLGFLETQGLMALYIFFYMIDDLIVFGLALWGAEKLQATETYSKWCNLFGGVLMMALGFLLIFFPNWLKF